MKQLNALLATALLAICLASCATRTEYVPIITECEPPTWPLLPLLTWGELWDDLGDTKYRVLERYINTLYGHAKEQEVMLKALCRQ